MARRLLLLLVLCLLFTACADDEAAYQRGYEEGLAEGRLEANTLITDAEAKAYELGYRTGLADCPQYDLGFNYPTYQEMLNFVAVDDTDELHGVNCIVFTERFLQNAHEAGWDCFAVILNFIKGGSHVLVGFDTVDKGRIFIEPQTDDEREVEIGRPYELYVCEGQVCYFKKYFIKQVGILK